MKIIHEIKTGEYDDKDQILIANFIDKVKSAYDEAELEDITFTLYKGYFPLQAVIHFKGDEHLYIRYNLYNKNLDIHETGCHCTYEQGDKSREYIVRETF